MMMSEDRQIERRNTGINLLRINAMLSTSSRTFGHD